MNIFRMLADQMHLASVIILLLKMLKTRSCAGISLKTQILYCVVFTARYVDLFMYFVSVYNSLMKLFFLGSSYYIVYLMVVKYKATRDPALDSMRAEFLVGGSVILSLIFHDSFTLQEVLWSFSIFLEAVAILPQLFQLQRTGEAETITIHYIFALGIYRALYILNWIYRYFAEDFLEPIALIAGIIQTILYCDFFYIYFKKVVHGKKFELPA